jgi:hypothetical protein
MAVGRKNFAWYLATGTVTAYDSLPTELPGWPWPGVPMGNTDAHFLIGMSGAGVWDDTGRLNGIAVAANEDVKTFVPWHAVRDFLDAKGYSWLTR